MDTAAIAAAFFDAIERGDLPAVRKLYADHALVWHNTDNAQQTVDENLALLGAFIGRTVSRAYVDRRLHLFAGGFVQQHRLCATKQDGSTVELHAAIICQVDEEHIVRLDEYLDSAAVTRFRN